MNPPKPTALRLVTGASGARAPDPPLGVLAWTADAKSTAILLRSERDWPGGSEIAAQVPDAATLTPLSLVVLFGRAARPRSFWARVLRPQAHRISRAARSEALLSRGYVDIGASRDAREDLVWGSAPAHRPSVP